MRDATVIETMTAGEYALRVVGATELERLLATGQITQAQHDAGARLRELRRASGADGYGVSWSECGCTGAWRGARLECMDEAREDRWRTYHYALSGLPPACRREVEAVAVRDESVQCLRALRNGLDLIGMVR